jgi:polysaccharide export outer membrane protein
MANVSDTAPNSSQYVIASGDTIQVAVWKEPSLSSSFPVRPDGMISIALIGDLPAAGFTPMALSTDISSRLKKYINQPNVTVTVLSVHAKQVYVLGEVQHVGPVAFISGMSPLQVLATAGGLTPYANGKKIYVLHGEPGKQQKIPFDYKKAIRDGNQQGVSLAAGDTIVVP